uniref:PAP-associated domain-containing protein n=1 Tax=Rhabditophanes sp. KR3021 TaxID=114890 RepID=A0AC35UDN0_9BILA
MKISGRYYNNGVETSRETQHNNRPRFNKNYSGKFTGRQSNSFYNGPYTHPYMIKDDFDHESQTSSLIQSFAENEKSGDVRKQMPNHDLNKVKRPKKKIPKELKMMMIEQPNFSQPPPPSPLTYHHSNNPIAPKFPGLDSRGRTFIQRMDQLSENIFHYHSTVSQTEANLNRKLYLRDMIYYTISPMFPLCGLYIVGSSLNGFGNNGSDMDLCLMVTNKELDQRKDAVPILNAIKNKMSKIEWVGNLQLIVAKVPILRITFGAPFQDIVVDLNANNSVGIKNTHLLCAYSNFDWRVRPLVSVIKEWAKKRGMNDANKSSFTSYSLVLMVIHYLQSGIPVKILPSLQNMFPERFNNKCDVRNLNVALSLDLPPTDKWKFNSDISLGEMLLGFFKYYATEFDYDEDAISVRLGTKLTRKDMFNSDVPHNMKSQWRCICIEEPFTYLNTAHSVYDTHVFKAIKNCFLLSYRALLRSGDFHQLMNGPSIQDELGNYALIPPGGVFFNSPKNGSNIYSHVSDCSTEPKKEPLDTENKYDLKNNFTSLANAKSLSTLKNCIQKEYQKKNTKPRTTLCELGLNKVTTIK